jgi:hypothetical protein
MKKRIALVIVMFGFSLQSQELEKELFDFWVGDWNLT